MSLFAALVRAYERLPDAPPQGYSSEKIGFAIALRPDGSVAEVIDLRADDRKRSPRMLLVPQAKKRTVGIDPNFLWDKSAYVLGVTAGEGKRTAQEHAEFVARHLGWLEGEDDPGLSALQNFLQSWSPEMFATPLWSDEMRDQNLVFLLAGERGFLHECTAAKALWARLRAETATGQEICLVTGEAGPIARLHPSIKGVWGAQSSGASLVSFNLDAFTSYDHEQGDNAPVSEAAAFAYTTALNRFLAKDSGHRVQIGDASTVFWADASDAGAAEEAEDWAAFMLGDRAEAGADEKLAEQKIAANLQRLRDGLPLDQVAPELAQGVRFYVLGLAPNAARLSVRFYWEDEFGSFVRNYQRYLSDMALEPPPRDGWPPLWRFLLELAAQHKRENVPPLVAGEWLRAILTGGPYPLTLMSTVLMRIRADGEVNARRAAMLKSVLIRNFKREVPVALDPTCEDRGYVLGRLFAVYEEIQRSALGGNLNATIKDKFYGAASAAPQKVFRTLDAGAQNHLSKLGKRSPGRKVNLEKLLGEIMEMMEPGQDPIPVSLNASEQALFGIGYYHQRSDFFRKHDDKTPEETQP